MDFYHDQILALFFGWLLDVTLLSACVLYRWCSPVPQGFPRQVENIPSGYAFHSISGFPPRDRGLDPRDRTNGKSLHVKPENVLGMAPLTLGTRNVMFVPSMALGDVKFNVLQNHLWVVFETRSSTWSIYAALTVISWLISYNGNKFQLKQSKS